MVDIHSQVGEASVAANASSAAAVTSAKTAEAGAAAETMIAEGVTGTIEAVITAAVGVDTTGRLTTVAMHMDPAVVITTIGDTGIRTLAAMLLRVIKPD